MKTRYCEREGERKGEWSIMSVKGDHEWMVVKMSLWRSLMCCMDYWILVG
jgi:hypothetical protein